MFLLFWSGPLLMRLIYMRRGQSSGERSWVRVYGDEVRAVLMESTIVWAARTDPASGSGATSAWPALVSSWCTCSQQFI